MTMKNLKRASAWMLLCVCIAGCAKKTTENDAPLTADQTTAKNQLEVQMKAAAQTAQTYHQMDSAALLSKLMEQSKAQRESFNSPAYRELRTRTNVDSNALVALVKQNDNAAGLLPLLLLRKLDNKSYLGVPADIRAKILTDALENSKFFNTWGLPGFYLEDASYAMLEAGKSAVPALRRMLSNTRPAPLFGSQEAMLSDEYKYRVCDYALFFLRKIDGQDTFQLPTALPDRDSLIKQMPAK
jgi:hypothetical protein